MRVILRATKRSGAAIQRAFEPAIARQTPEVPRRSGVVWAPVSSAEVAGPRLCGLTPQEFGTGVGLLG
jgi:hypothetical protein